MAEDDRVRTDERRSVEDVALACAFGKCRDMKLPEGFADRLARHVAARDAGGGASPASDGNGIRSAAERGVGGKGGKGSRPCAGLWGVCLLAASLMLLLGFAPTILPSGRDGAAAPVACDGIRAAAAPQDSRGELNALAMLGFCREALRRRTRLLLDRFRRRRRPQDDE